MFIENYCYNNTHGFYILDSNVNGLYGNIMENSGVYIEGDEITQAGIKVASVVKYESLLTINKSMIIKVLGMLSGNGIHKVNEC